MTRPPEPTHYLPEDALTPEELALIAAGGTDPVDVAAALAWMVGDGPDPWQEPNS